MPEELNFFTAVPPTERLMGRCIPVGEVCLEWLAQPEGLPWLDVGRGNGAFTEFACRAVRARRGAGPRSVRRSLSYARTEWVKAPSNYAAGRHRSFSLTM